MRKHIGMHICNFNWLLFLVEYKKVAQIHVEIDIESERIINLVQIVFE